MSFGGFFADTPCTLAQLYVETAHAEREAAAALNLKASLVRRPLREPARRDAQGALVSRSRGTSLLPHDGVGGQEANIFYFLLVHEHLHLNNNSLPC